VDAVYTEDLPAVRRLLAALPPGETARFTIVRNETRADREIVPVVKGKVEGDDLELKEWDLTLKEINRYTDRLLAYFRAEGVFIQGVKSGGNARMSGLRAGDILLTIDGEDVSDLGTARRLYERLETLPRGKRTVLCEVLRGGYPTWIVLDFNRESPERLQRGTGQKETF
jgi:hypothetical protein